MNGREGPTDVLPRGAAAAAEEKDQTARALLTEEGFDPNDLKKRNRYDWTPITNYSRRGNVTMVRYLIAHGADCRKPDSDGYFPLLLAAMYGHLEIIKLLSHDGDAHEDIRRVTRAGYSPLRVALRYDHFEVAYWLLLNGALWSPHDGDWFRWWQGRNDGGIVQERERGWIEDGVENGGINDATLRNDLSPAYLTFLRKYGPDNRETVLAWARDAVATHAKVVTLLLTGTIASASTSPLVVFDGKSGILPLIAQYVAGTPQQVRMLRQLMVLLSAFIDDTQFVEEEEGEEDGGEDEEEEDY